MKSQVFNQERTSKCFCHTPPFSAACLIRLSRTFLSADQSREVVRLYFNNRKCFTFIYTAVLQGKTLSREIYHRVPCPGDEKVMESWFILRGAEISSGIS